MVLVICSPPLMSTPSLASSACPYTSLRWLPAFDSSTYCPSHATRKPAKNLLGLEVMLYCSYVAGMTGAGLTIVHLMQIIHPSASRHDATGADVHNLYFPVAHNVVDIPLEELPGPQGREHIQAHGHIVHPQVIQCEEPLLARRDLEVMLKLLCMVCRVSGTSGF